MLSELEICVASIIVVAVLSEEPVTHNEAEISPVAAKIEPL